MGVGVTECLDPVLHQERGGTRRDRCGPTRSLAGIPSCLEAVGARHRRVDPSWRGQVGHGSPVCSPIGRVAGAHDVVVERPVLRSTIKPCDGDTAVRCRLVVRLAGRSAAVISVSDRVDYQDPIDVGVVDRVDLAPRWVRIATGVADQARPPADVRDVDVLGNRLLTLSASRFPRIQGTPRAPAANRRTLSRPGHPPGSF